MKCDGYTIVSAIATIAFFWYLLESIRNVDSFNLLVSAVLLTVLVFVAIICCPLCRQCCVPGKKGKK